MRAVDIAITALALRASPPQPPKHERRLVPAVDEPDAAILDRNALGREQTALIASLWPRAGLCLLAPHYLELPSPALFSAMLRVTWHAPDVEHEHRLPLAEGEVQVAWAA
jgi:hypothetical protein